MTGIETAIRGGTVVTAEGSFRADLGLAGGRVVAVAERVEGAARTVEADGLLVLPGGVDSHCHIEEPSRGPDGRITVNEESFTSASRSALAGGTTTVVCFVPQWKGEGVLPRFDDYAARAKRGAMVDHAFHQIVTDPTDDVVARELPEVVRRGVRSFKVFLTYEPLHVGDAQYLRVLRAARELGCLVTVHCENYDAIKWRIEALLAAGMSAPKYHAWARPPVVEREATHRAIALAELVDQPIQIFHVSCEEAAEEIARAQARGLRVWGETCPQYVTLTADDMDRPGFEGAKFMCSPAPRGRDEHARVWEMVRRGTLDVVSSDHCAFSYEGPLGKRQNGGEASFDAIPNGIPGLAARLALVWSEGVAKGRIAPEHFVRVTSTNPAKLMGLWPRKGGLHVGADADVVLWDPTAKRRLTNALMQHAVDHTPYEGMEVTGWPVRVFRRGEEVMRDGAVVAEPGSGEYLPRGPYDLIRPRGVTPNGV
jgi:dihydropyrimidinase